ncbi:cytochrome P450 4X1-like isoform X2 [Vombatus ursinus]|uniref:cytochrome P450 4X1-like isoform X2 n=1 Tax=Vombatus ursinus TaxID=29139 RepID=UPI000FFD2BD6|nr:cytochrome P450 4X1-like isoform X2 [Vombatus ursinus]
MDSDSVPTDSGMVPWLERHRTLSLVLTFTLVLLLRQVVKLYLRHQGLLRALRPFPGPPTHWLYGNQKKCNLEELEMFKELPKKYPSAFSFWVGPFHAVLHIYDPEYVKTFLNRKDLKCPVNYKFLILWLGNGLLLLHGETWHHHRRLMTTAFHFNVMNDYFYLIKDSICTMLDEWGKLRTEDSSMDIYQSLSLMALDSILKCIFSVQDFCKEKSFSTTYLQNISKISSCIYECLHTFFYYSDFIYKLSPACQEFQALCQEVKKQSAKIFQDRKASLKSPEKQNKIQKKKKYRDLLDILFQAQGTEGGGFTDEEIMDEINTFMCNNHNTLASGLSWILYCLAMNPEHQKKCREEIQGILEDKDSITLNHLNQMPYSAMCIKEALRLYPPVPRIAREFSKPITFPDGRSLPPGMIIVLNIWALHHNPAVWENPQSHCRSLTLKGSLQRIAIRDILMLSYHFLLDPGTALGSTFP